MTTKYVWGIKGGVIMNNKLLIGIIVVLVIAAVFFPPALIAVWIYLVWMVWKKKTNIFHDQMEPKLAERRYKMLKAFLLVAVISWVMIWVSIFLGPYIFHLPEEAMDNVVLIALSFHVVSSMATIGGFVTFLKGRRKTT